MTSPTYSFGLDIGGTKTLGVLLDAHGEIVSRVQEPTLPGADGVVTTAVRIAKELIAEAGVPLPALGALGVGVPGLVDAGTGTVRHAVNLALEDEDLPLAERVSEALGHPVAVENDVNAAALGAAALLDQDSDGEPADLAFLSLGTGLAAGLVLGGRLRRGFRGAAGEIGHLPVDPTGLLCGCGQRGCLETLASGSALAEAWPVAAGTFPAEALFAAAAVGDLAAIAVRDRFARAVAEAVRALAVTVDVRHLVLGGGVAHVGEPLRGAVVKALTEQAVGSSFLTSLRLAERVQVVPDGYPVAAVGAALVGVEESPT